MHTIVIKHSKIDGDNQCMTSLKALEMKDSLLAYLAQDTKCQNEVARLLRSLLPTTVV